MDTAEGAGPSPSHPGPGLPATRQPPAPGGGVVRGRPIACQRGLCQGLPHAFPTLLVPTVVHDMVFRFIELGTPNFHQISLLVKYPNFIFFYSHKVSYIPASRWRVLMVESTACFLRAVISPFLFRSIRCWGSGFKKIVFSKYPETVRDSGKHPLATEEHPGSQLCM